MDSHLNEALTEELAKAYSWIEYVRETGKTELTYEEFWSQNNKQLAAQRLAKDSNFRDAVAALVAAVDRVLSSK